MDHLSPSIALIVGVTGQVGLTLAQSLKSPTCPGSPWTVYGVARRPPPPYLPPLDRYIRFDTLDRPATNEALAPIAPYVTHLFFVALAARDNEEDNIADNRAMLANVLNALTSSPGFKLRHVALQTGTKHYMGPLIPGRKIEPADRPFSEESPRRPVMVFYYALEDLLASYSPSLSWSVHRSSIILGASDRTIYNCMLTLAVYALICRHEGSPFVYPGSLYTWEHFCDASDAELLAKQQIWAATTPAAANEAFNCTNGDVFTWCSFWRAIADVFEVEFVPCKPENIVGSEWVEMIKGKGNVWDDIVEKNGLLKTKLEEITGFEAVYFVLNFDFQHVSSMNKSREFGFNEWVNALKSIKGWVEKLREMNIIPK